MEYSTTKRLIIAKYSIAFAYFLPHDVIQIVHVVRNFLVHEIYLISMLVKYLATRNDQRDSERVDPGRKRNLSEGDRIN